MKILVTGGGGYIGSALSIELAKQGHDVTVIDHFYHGHDSIDPMTKLGIAVWDIKLFQDYPFLLKDKDVIFHLAAIAGSKACDEAGSELAWDYNVKNTKKLIDCLSGDELLIFASTSAVYGSMSNYTKTKLAAETSVSNYKNSIVVRLPTIFGISPCMRDNILVHDLVKSAVDNGYIVLWDKDSTRTWMSLEDCVSGLIGLMYRSDILVNKTWDVDGNYFSKIKVAGKIHMLTGCELLFSQNEGKYIQDFYKVLRHKINYAGGLLDTIEELVKYYEGIEHSPAIDWSK